MTLGDLLMQSLERYYRNRDQAWDPKRTLIVSSYAVIFQGPIYCAWYRYILPRLAPITAENNIILLNR